MVNKRFRVCSYDQPFLLPPSLQDWLPENHLARFIAEVMNELDLSSIYASYERSDGRGLAAYHPTLMARLLLYGYCIGITSSRKIEQATYDNVAFRYLSAYQGAEADEQAWYRAIYLSKVGNAIYVLHCFEKESRKTDRRDIEVAGQRLKVVRQRLQEQRAHEKRSGK